MTHQGWGAGALAWPLRGAAGDTAPWHGGHKGAHAGSPPPRAAAAGSGDSECPVEPSPPKQGSPALNELEGPRVPRRSQLPPAAGARGARGQGTPGAGQGWGLRRTCLLQAGRLLRGAPATRQARGAGSPSPEARPLPTHIDQAPPCYLSSRRAHSCPAARPQGHPPATPLLHSSPASPSPPPGREPSRPHAGPGERPWGTPAPTAPETSRRAALPALGLAEEPWGGGDP